MALFENVTNSLELKQRLLDQDPTLTGAFVDARFIVNAFHVLLAVNRAVYADQIGKLKTHNIHSEVVFDFSSNPNIVKTFAQFGMQATTTSLVAIKIGGSAEEAEEFMKASVKGDIIPFKQLDQLHDLKMIEEVYGIMGLEQDADKMMALISGAMALKGF
ncbi:CGI-121-domain-containing protein [Backusella circina FSU 941]|nr:CGI-121-domain-containing protein [Backusella circina FSU 941]